MKLNGETIRVIGKELPWLPALLDKINGEFKVQVLDLDTLSLKIRGDHRLFRAYLVTKDGKEIGEIGRVVRHHQLVWPFSWLAKLMGRSTVVDREEFFHETLEGAVNRLRPTSGNLQFVLHLDGYLVTLYKVPKGMNFVEHMERKKNEADAAMVSFLKDS